jgi:hypothetical protein
MSCIKWEGHKQANGYGKAYNPRTQKIDMAHRVAWEKVNGQAVPEGMVVMHTCANRLCVNPEHLEVGTQHENRVEMVQRGVNPKQKLTWEEAELIRWCGLQGPKKYGWGVAVAREFGVSKNAISRILRGHTFQEAAL